MRKKFFVPALALILIVATATIFFLLRFPLPASIQEYILLPYLKNQLPYLKINFSSISTNLVNSIYINDFAIYPTTYSTTPIFVAKAAILRYNIFKGIKLDAIQKISFRDCKLQLDTGRYEEILSLYKNFNNVSREKAIKPLLVEVCFYNLRLSLLNAAKNKIYGDYEIITMKFKTRNRKANFTLLGKYFSDKKQSFFVNVDVEDISKAEKLRVSCKNLPLSLFNVVSDKMKCEGGVFWETTICKRGNFYSCDGKIALSSAKISIMDGVGDKTFTIGESVALYHLYRDTLVVEQCNMEICGNKVMLSGDVKNIFSKDIAANLKIKFIGLNIAKFSLLFPQMQLDKFFSSSSESAADAKIVFRGNFSTYTLLVNLEGRIYTKFGELLNLQANISHNENSTVVNSLTAKINSGKVEAVGSVKGRSCSFFVKMHKVDLVRVIHLEGVAGIMPSDINISISRDDERLSIFSNFYISASKPLNVAIKGELQMRTEDKFYVKGQLLPFGYNFLYEGVEKDGNLFIRKGEFVFSQKEKIFTTGKLSIYSTGEDNMSLSITSDLIPLDRFYSKLTGEMRLSGVIYGNILSPVVSVNFQGREKSLGEYRCSLYSSTGTSKNLQISFESIRGGGKQFNWERLAAHASYSGSDKRLQVNKILLKQRDGGELLFYLVPVRKQNFSSCVIKGDNFKFYDREISFLFDGKYTKLQNEEKLSLFTPYFNVNGTTLGDLSVIISFRDKNIYAEFLGLNSRLSSNLSIKGGKITYGKLNFANLEFSRIGKIFLSSVVDKIDKNGGNISGNVTISGKLLSPDFNGNVVLRNFPLLNKKCSIESSISALLSKNVILGKTKVSFIKKGISSEKEAIGLSWSFLVSSFAARPHEMFLSFEKDLTCKDFTIYAPKAKFIFDSGKLFRIYSELNTDKGDIVLEEGSFVKFADDGRKLEFYLRTKIKNISIANVTVWGNLNLKGKYFFHDNNVEAAVESPTFWVNQYNFSNFGTYVVKKGGLLYLYPDKNSKYTVESNIEFLGKDNIKFTYFKVKELNNEIFSVKGKYNSKDLDISINGNKFPLDILLGIFNFKANMEGYSNFQLLVTGSIDNPKIVGQIDSIEGKIYNLPYTKLSAWFSVKDKMVDVSYGKIYLKDKYILDISGVFPLKKEGYYNAKCSIPNCDLSILPYLFSWIKNSKGTANGNLYIRGPFENPSLEGEVRIYKGEFFATDLVKNITSVNGEIVLKNNSFVVKNFEGYAGKGNFTISGSGVIGKGGIEYDFTLQTKGETGINVSWGYLAIPQSSLFGRILAQPSYGEAKVDVEVKGSKDQTRVVGVIELNNAHFTYPPKQEVKFSAAEGYSKLYLDLTIVANKNVWYENELIRANIEGEVKIKGPANNLEVNGNIKSYRGVLSYLGKIFNLKYAELEIRKNTPYLECRAEASVSLPLSSDASVYSSPTNLILEIAHEKLVNVKPKLYSTDREFAKYSTEDFLKQIGKYQEPFTVEKIEPLLREEVIKLFDSALVSPLAKFMLQEAKLVDNIVITQEETNISKKEEAVSSPISIVDILAGTKYTFQKSISGQTFFEYILKLDRSALFQNKLDIKQEIAFSHRWRNLLLRASIGIPENIAQPLNSERKISVEVHDRFGW